MDLAPVDPAAVRRALGGRRFGADVRVVEQTGSTNSDLMALLSRGEVDDGAVLVAEHQTAGKGRVGRTWQSPPGLGLLVSVVARHPLATITLVPLAAGVAVIDGTVFAGTALKWPNDVMAGGRKVGGILVEALHLGQAGVQCVIGIGLNVNHSADELPDAATSLRVVTGTESDRSRLLVALLVALEERLAQDPSGLVRAYRECCITLRQHVRVDRANGPIEGTALDIDATGALVVGTESGVVTVTAGDVVHVRTSDGGRA